IVAASCTRSQTGGQKTFATPEGAGEALFAAAKTNDERAMTALFGPDGKQAIFAGNAATDKSRLQEFVNAYQQMHRWSEIKAGGQVLHVGAANYPFPVPLGQNASGRWYFDTAAGKDEILARRIGRNELAAMDATTAIAGAEHEYWGNVHDGGKPRQYAQK